MFKILTHSSRGLVLEVSDDTMANALEGYFRDERSVLFERRPEAECVRFYFGEAGCEKAVDGLVQDFLKWRKERND